MISFAAAQRRMNMKGTAVVNRPVGETPGICWIRQRERVSSPSFTCPLLGRSRCTERRRWEYLRKLFVEKLRKEGEERILAGANRVRAKFVHLKAIVDDDRSFSIVQRRITAGSRSSRSNAAVQQTTTRIRPRRVLSHAAKEQVDCRSSEKTVRREQRVKECVVYFICWTEIL